MLTVDTTLSGLINSFGVLTQGSSFLATLGWMIAILSGLPYTASPRNASASVGNACSSRVKKSIG